MATVRRVRKSNLEQGRKYMEGSSLGMEGIMKAWVALIDLGTRHFGRLAHGRWNLLLGVISLYTHVLK